MDSQQKRQLLLHSTGPGVQEIFETLNNTGEDHKRTADKLAEYFTPSSNVPYNRGSFRQEAQAGGESVTQGVTRLRQFCGIV